MEEPKQRRGLTLRKKGARRPKISAPTAISSPLPAGQKPSLPAGPGKPTSTLDVPQPRPSISGASGGTTSDLVKRRYSTRFNQVDLKAGAPPVPGLPAFPAQYDAYRPSTSASGKSARPSSDAQSSTPVQIDPSALGDKSLQADKYIANLLSNASDLDIREYQTGLQKLRRRNSAELTQAISQNRNQFIKVSKEAEKLKGEMRSLQTLMSELTGALGQANIADDMSKDVDESFTSKRANRSSVANLEVMRNTQLQTMWKRIERSQKFLPAIPGRHIIMESGQWVELDSATWKPRRPVHIVLLNDNLLVASKKRKRVEQGAEAKGPAQIKVVAEECWPLQDIDMIDLATNVRVEDMQEASAKGITSAINIRHGSRSFTYRVERGNPKPKTELLQSFRKAAEDLRKTLRAELSTPIRADGMNGDLNGTDQSLTPLENTPDLSASTNAAPTKIPATPELLIDVDGKQENLRWVESQMDDLELDIALQHFEQSVQSIEKMRKLAKSLKSNPVAQEVINSKVDERAVRLAGVVCRQLVDTHSFAQATKVNIDWLVRLGFEEVAKEKFLGARGEMISQRARQCIYSGDLPRYIFQITFVYLTMIKHTISIFASCFPAPATSAAIKWAKDNLERLNVILVRQLGGFGNAGGVKDAAGEVSAEEYERCVRIVKELKEGLRDVGVDFGDVIGRGWVGEGML